MASVPPPTCFPGYQKFPPRALIIKQTREIHQATSYSTSTSSCMTIMYVAQTQRKQSGWEKARMVLSLRRPRSLPCISAQRTFRAAVKDLLSGHQPDSLRNSASSTSELHIPESASFAAMLNEKTNHPIQLADFAAYLTAEGTVKNLIFLLWHRDYARRFASLTPDDMMLHPPWTNEDHERAVKSLPQNQVHHQRHSVENALCHQELSYHNKADSPYDSTRSSIANSDNEKDDLADFHLPQALRPPPRRKWRTNSNIIPIQMAEKPLDIKLVAPWDEPPLTTPLKPSFNSLISAKQNLPVSIDALRADVASTLRKYNTLTYPACLNALDLPPESTYLLTYSTARSLHPSSFSLAVHHVEHILRSQSYPRFLLSVSTNANPARLNCVFLAGAFVNLASLAASIAAIVFDWARAMRIPGAVGMGVGMAVIYAAWRGMCLILLALGKAQDPPWVNCNVKADGTSYTVASSVVSKERELESGTVRGAWLKQYRRRWFLSRVFEHERRVETGFVRDAQDLVFLQALWVGFVAVLVMCTVFLPVSI